MIAAGAPDLKADPEVNWRDAMGQALNKHDLFLQGLKEALKTRGTRVKKKDLRKFFEFVSDVCPWFSQEGTVDEKRWGRVGGCLKDYYRSFGPERVPIVTFSYWHLINEVLKTYNHSPEVQKVVQE